MRWCGLVFFVFLVAKTTHAAYVPPAALNRYCGAHIYSPTNYATCQYLLQSGFALVTSPSTTNRNTIVYQIYKIPPLPETTNTDQDILNPALQTYVPLDNVTVSNLFNSTLTPAKFPDHVTLSFPYCADTAFSFVEASDNLQVEEWDPTGTFRVNTTVDATPAACRGMFLMDYEPVCGARNSITFDTHCGPDNQINSFTSCSTNQTQINPLPYPATVAYAGNVTSAIPPAAYEFLSQTSYTVPISKCQNLGTRAWQLLYNGAFPNTRNGGVPTKDLGAPADLAGTITLTIPTACSALPITRFAIKATGMFNAAEAAAPVAIVYSGTTFGAQRVAFASSGSCATVVPRPTGSAPDTPALTLTPYCRVTVFAYPDIFGYLLATLDSLPYYPPTYIQPNTVVYALSVTGLPADQVYAWARVKFEDPVNPQSTEIFGPYEIKNGYLLFLYSSHDFVAQPASRIVYIQRFNADNPWEKVAIETQISTAPYCSCSQAQDVWTLGGMIPCRPNGDNRLINETQVPFYPWTATVQTVSGTVPVCSLALTNGYLDTIDSVLQQGVYTATAAVTAGNSFQWSFSSSTPGAAVFLNATTGLGVQFSVNTQVTNLLLTFTVANNTVFPPLTSSCSLKLNVFKGLPIPILEYPSQTLSLGGNPAILNGSRSISTTGEPLTWKWAISYPDPTTVIPGTLLTTGNVSVNQFYPLQTGTFTISMTVSTPRKDNFVTLTAVLNVANSTTPTNNSNIPSTCISSITNGNISDPSMPPYDNTTAFNPQPPQQDPLVFSPSQASPPDSTTPAGTPSSGGTNPTEPIYTVSLVIAAILGGLVFLYVVGLVVWSLVKCCKKYTRK